MAEKRRFANIRRSSSNLWLRLTGTPETGESSGRQPVLGRLVHSFSAGFQRLRSPASSETTSDPPDSINSPTTVSFPVADISSRRTFADELSIIIQEGETLPSAHKKTQLGAFCTIKRQGPSSRVSPKVFDDCYPKLTELLLSKSHLWEFDTFLLDRATGGHSLPALGMYLLDKYELISYFELNPVNCIKLFNLIEGSYHPMNPYHNAVHATDVTQSIHCFLQQPLLLDNLKKIEILVVLIAAFTHDVDHPGFGKSYLAASQHLLSVLYKDHEMGKHDRTPLPRPKKFLQRFRKEFNAEDSNDKRGKATDSGASSTSSLFRKKKQELDESILECHHWRVAYSCILQSEVFNHMSTDLPHIKRLLKELILATDITRQQDYLKAFKFFLNRKNLDMTLPDHRLMVLQIALKTADISNPGRSWAISRKWSLKVCDEFYKQGDKEREMKIPISYFCNREQDTIPTIQTGFIRSVAEPLYSEFNTLLRSELTLKIITNAVHNAAEWEREARRSEEGILITTQGEDPQESSLKKNHSVSTECLLQEAGASAPRVAPRRSSYSPARASAVKDALRRFSAPLQALVGAPRVISEVLLREELHPGWRPPPPADYNPSERKTPRRSAEEIRRSRTLSRLELAMAVAADRSRSDSRRSSHSLERSPSPRPSPHRPAGPTPPRAYRPPPLPELESNGSPLGFSAKDGDSANGVQKFRLGSFVLAECNFDGRDMTPTSITTSTDPHILSTVTDSLSTPSSDCRIFFPMTSDNASCATGSCEAVVQQAASREECCDMVARLIPELARRRRGSAPVIAGTPTSRPHSSFAPADPKKLSASYAALTFHRVVEAVPPVRRGSLPVMSGISAL